MIPSKHLSVLIAATAAVWAGLLIWGGVAASSEMLRPFSTVTGIVGLLLVLFDKYMWRIPFLYPWFVDVPNMQGVWKTEIRSNWVNPEIGQKSASIHGFMVIRQTFSQISIRQLTEESSSQLLAGRIVPQPDGLKLLVGVYCNEPKHSVRNRSPIHYGSLKLSIIGNPVVALSGHYWTDRSSQGELYLSDCKKAFPEDYESARKLFQSAT